MVWPQVKRQTLQPQANPQAVVRRRAVSRRRADLWVLQGQEAQEAVVLWVLQVQGQEVQGQEVQEQEVQGQEVRGQEVQGVQEAQEAVLSPDYEF